MNTEVIHGGRYADARGVLRFCNDFDLSAVKRFYTIANSAEQPVRGKTVIGVESFNAEEQRGREAEDFVLVAEEPRVLKVPPGNWFKIVQDGDAEIMVFSDCRVGEFEGDDFRREL